MATIENNYVGNGSTVLYSFTFPYISESDVKVSLNGVDTTQFTFANATTLQLATAPGNGVAVRIYRSTASDDLEATFYPGSAIRAQDLNSNFTQNLYVTQEASSIAGKATTTANTALSTANSAAATAASAVTTANSAVSTANTASSNASSAVTTANTASSNASAAVTTANTASSNASAAVSTANTASSNASTALSTANTAISTANTASSVANTASTNASAAVTTANTALSTANSASTTANNAVTTANSASSTATSANNKADQAIAAVSNSINFLLKANVAAIPTTPANDTYIEVQDSTGLESFTPLAGKPTGFVGDSGLSVRLRYTSAGSTWNWLNYYANNSETRYLKLTGGTLTGPVTLAGAPTSNLHPATKAYVDGYVSAINGDIASLSSTKLSSSTAASTYQTLAGMSSYLTTASASSTYLTQSSAASTYQTQAGMSSYVPTSAIGTTVQAFNANNAVTDVAQTFTKAQRGSYVTLTDGATVSIDMSQGNNFQVTLGGNRTLGAPTNVVAGQSGVIRVIQDGTGSRTLAYNSIFKFPGGTAPTLTTAANSVDLLAYAVETTGRIAVRFIGDVK